MAVQSSGNGTGLRRNCQEKARRIMYAAVVSPAPTTPALSACSTYQAVPQSQM